MSKPPTPPSKANRAATISTAASSPDTTEEEDQEEEKKQSPRVFAKPRRSVRMSDVSSLLPQGDQNDQVDMQRMDTTNLTRDEAQEQYKTIIAEARQCIGHGAEEGAFPEEWDAQLVIDAGRSSEGYRILIFTPAFLKALLQDGRELDRAVKYILFTLDRNCSLDKYVFIYCHSGMDWTYPSLAHRLRIAYDILPAKFSRNLKTLYIVHATAFFRMTMWSFSAFLNKSFWQKIEYISTLDEILKDLCPKDPSSLRRRFPQLVQREDCLRCGTPPPLTFGVPLQRLCDSFGVDYTDKTTGRLYPRLPPPLVFVCEALERQAADEAFSYMFTSDFSVTYDLVAALDEGEPLDPDTQLSALWCTLKLFVDCLPSPLLGEEAFTDLSKELRDGSEKDRLSFLSKVLRSVTKDAAYMALYLASFLHTMCQSAKKRPSSGGHGQTIFQCEQGDEGEFEPLTATLAAEVFAPGFLRPRHMKQMKPSSAPACASLLETFIEHADNPDLWIGTTTETTYRKMSLAPSPSSSEDESADYK